MMSLLQLLMKHMHNDWLVAPSTRLLHLLEQKDNLLKGVQEVMVVKRDLMIKMKVQVRTFQKT